MDILNVYTFEDHGTLKFACLAVAELASDLNQQVIYTFQELHVAQIISTILLKYIAIDAIAEGLVLINELIII